MNTDRKKPGRKPKPDSERLTKTLQWRVNSELWDKVERSGLDAETWRYYIEVIADREIKAM